MAFKSTSNSWLRSETDRLDRTASIMAQVMVNRGVMLAPELTGALKRSGRTIKKSKGSYSATFGGANVGVPYAKLRNFVNKKNPQTLNYSEKSGKSVASEGVAKYYRMAGGQ